MTTSTSKPLSDYATMCRHCGEVELILAQWPDDVVTRCHCWCHLYRKGEWYSDDSKRKRRKH